MNSRNYSFANLGENKQTNWNKAAVACLLLSEVSCVLASMVSYNKLAPQTSPFLQVKVSEWRARHFLWVVFFQRFSFTGWAAGVTECTVARKEVSKLFRQEGSLTVSSLLHQDGYLNWLKHIARVKTVQFQCFIVLQADMLVTAPELWADMASHMLLLHLSCLYLQYEWII